MRHPGRAACVPDRLHGRRGGFGPPCRRIVRGTVLRYDHVMVFTRLPGLPPQAGKKWPPCRTRRSPPSPRPTPEGKARQSCRLARGEEVEPCRRCPERSRLVASHAGRRSRPRRRRRSFRRLAHGGTERAAQHAPRLFVALRAVESGIDGYPPFDAGGQRRFILKPLWPHAGVARHNVAWILPKTSFWAECRLWLL